MALNMTVPTVRLTLAVSLSALLAACSLGKSPSVVVVDTPTQVNTRFDASDEAAQYTSVVPRAYISEDALDERAPDLYTVVRGDTLWDISDRFLKEPWRWTEIWGYNPQIYNPHLIFPGDELALEYVNGRPTLRLTRNGKPVPLTPALGAANSVVLDADGAPIPNSGNRTRVSPRIRSQSLDDAIPAISGESIRQFLVYPRVVDSKAIARAPYIVANDDGHLISSVGHRIFARGKLNRDQTSYGVFRPGKALRDPINNALLGYEVNHIADAKLLSTGDPSTLMITSNKMETIAGDILLATSDGSATHTYVPRLPELRGEGRIVSLVNAISQTGRNQVVVLNIGSDSSIQQGDVLAIESRGKPFIDRRGKSSYEHITLPNTRTGVVMVFKTFDKVSYGLVMESTRPVLINDIITGI